MKYVVRRISAYLAGLFLVSLVIGLHETGHLVAAKSTGVYCHQFSIGFGPGMCLWSAAGTDYYLRAVPLGGFVAMATDPQDLPPGAPADALAVSQVSAFSKVVIFGAGVGANFLTAGAVIVFLRKLGRPSATMKQRHQLWVTAAEESEFRKRFWRIFSNGPVLVLMYVSRGLMFGKRGLLAEAGNLSIALAIFNSLPIPPLDGYRVVDAIFFRSFMSSSAGVEQSSTGGIAIVTAGVICLLVYIILGFIPSIVRLVRFERILYRSLHPERESPEMVHAAQLV